MNVSKVSLISRQNNFFFLGIQKTFAGATNKAV